MSTKQNYVNKLQAQLDEWAAEKDKLKAKAEGATADLQIEYNKQLKELQNKQKAANEKLADLKKASEESWEELKEDIDTAWSSLETTVKSLTSKFK